MACWEKGACWWNTRSERIQWQQIDSGMVWLISCHDHVCRTGGICRKWRSMALMDFFDLWRRRKLDMSLLINCWSYGDLLLLLRLPSLMLFWVRYHGWSSCIDCWRRRISTALEASRTSLCLSKQNLLSACQQRCCLKFSFLCSVSCMSLQTYIPALYHKVKLLQNQALHDHFPSLTKSLESTSSSNQISLLHCPNPYHPVSFTTDMWTGSDHESYICLTAHWFTPDWQLQHALLDIVLCTDRHTGENLIEWIKQVLHANDLCVWSILLCFCFAWFLIDCSLFAASWCWSSDSWSWCWRDESSAIERDPWLSMFWSWTRSERQCWSWLPRFRSHFYQGFQRGFNNQILQQPLSRVARRSSKGVSVFFRLCQASSLSSL